MADIQSISFLRDREAARRWYQNTKAGNYAAELMLKEKGSTFSAIYNKRDGWVQWTDMVQEHRNDLAVAADCAEARAAFDLARGARNSMMPPMKTAANWMRFMSVPDWYFFRKQIDTADPYYWNDQKNVLREALDNPQWCTVPADVIRGELERLMPKPAAARPTLFTPFGVKV